MDAPRPITPPGWYDDGHGQLRWYDGSEWTQHTAPLTRPAAPPVAQRPAAPPRAQARTGDLVQVKRSKLVWILPIVFVVAALVGALSAAALWSAGSFGAEPLERTYAEFAQAEQNRDCAAVVAVTTQNFRDDMFDDQPFTCDALAASPPVVRDGEPVWGLRMGPVGILVVEEESSDPDDSYDGSAYTAYTLIREDGRWKLDESD